MSCFKGMYSDNVQAEICFSFLLSKNQSTMRAWNLFSNDDLCIKISLTADTLWLIWSTKWFTEQSCLKKTFQSQFSSNQDSIHTYGVLIALFECYLIAWIFERETMETVPDWNDHIIKEDLQEVWKNPIETKTKAKLFVQTEHWTCF